MRKRRLYCSLLCSASEVIASIVISTSRVALFRFESAQQQEQRGVGWGCLQLFESGGRVWCRWQQCSTEGLCRLARRRPRSSDKSAAEPTWRRADFVELLCISYVHYMLSPVRLSSVCR